MNWFNYYGLVIVIVMMIPNIIYSIYDKDAFVNIYQNKLVEFFEQVGRYLSIILMIFNIPYTYFNFWLSYGLLIYLITNGILLALYLLGWIFLNKYKILRAYFLSIIPSLIFVISGVMLLNIPLIISSIIFSFCHITISLKNAYNKK